MTVGLFVPCYVDQLYPRVAVATLEVLERLGCRVEVPRGQTCCGQPMANAGCAQDAWAAHRLFRKLFDGYDYVVGPSGSCVLHVRERVGRAVWGDRVFDRGGAATGEHAERGPGGGEITGPRVYELCQFLVEVLRVDRLDVSFPRRVGLHTGCHALRGLRLACSTERQDPPFDQVAYLLGMVEGLERVPLDRPDECCGFGGTFAVNEEAVSVRMGQNRLDDYLRHGAEAIVSTDMSCLMHLEGLIRREGIPLPVFHVAEVLNAGAGAAVAEAPSGALGVVHRQSPCESERSHQGGKSYQGEEPVLRKGPSGASDSAFVPLEVVDSPAAVVDHPASIVDHPAAAARFNADRARVTRHDAALWHIRRKRDQVADVVDGWERLRDLASQIKEHTLSNLDAYLVQFEERAVANGVHVHWAADAEEHNRIVTDILERRGVRRIVKSKSMLTEECGLNPWLEARGIEVIDTDLGERIVQLREEVPSHIVAPAIHVTKEEIGRLFHERLGTPVGVTDPQELTRAMRHDLRARFHAPAAVTGVNFAVAETGGFVVATNEGNADLGTHLAPVHVACMGIEKLIPRVEHLGVFLRLLARSSTGQPLTVYTSHFHWPAPGRELHVVLVDNGRTDQLAREDFRASLKCIRCGACLNTCPVYRRSGGHSYGTALSGPIGAILNPGRDLRKYATLPFASTLCGSCTDVCPVKIDIHEQLYRWREMVVAGGRLSMGKRAGMRMAGWVLGHPVLYRVVGRAVRSLLRRRPYRLLRAWSRARELPEPALRSFQEWFEGYRGTP